VALIRARRGAVRAAITVLAGVSLLATAACGGADRSSASGDEPIRIGLIYTLSGPAASIGEVYRSAAEMWREKNPQIAGRPVELVIKDDEGTAEGGTEAARALVDAEEVDAVAGPFLSGPSSAVLPILTRAGTFSVALSSLPEAGDPQVSPYSVQIESQKRLEAPSTVAAAAAAGAGKLGLLVVDNPLGQTTVDSVSAEAEKAGSVTVVGVEKFQSGATDVSGQLRKLVDSGADALVIPAVGVPDYAVALRAVGELGFTGPIFGNSALAQPALAESVPAEILARARASGFTASVLAGSLTPEMEQFRTDLAAFMKTERLPFFLYLAATSYDALDIIKAGIEGAGSADAQAIVDHLVANGHGGMRLDYRFTADDHLGLRAEDLRWGVAGTFDNGVVAGDPDV
jgi:branched-chain amino acid transport system substrate-binding protein